MSWVRLEAEAPELAALARDQLEVFGVAMLATLRGDGSPQLDPIEPVFSAGEILIGSGRATSKSRNLRRDPRFALHGLVRGANAGDPDVKLAGRVEPSQVLAGWWADRARDADVYALSIAEAVVVEWNLRASRMRVHRWAPARGPTVSERSYP
jgi:hypothetical protein